MRKLFTVALITLLSTIINISKTEASHIAGADWSYECLGGDTFFIRLNIYRDCSGVVMNTNISVNFYSDCSTVSDTLNLYSVAEASQVCPSAISNTSCNGGSLPGYERYIYSDTVVLPACPSSPYIFDWGISARNGSNNYPAAQFIINAELGNNLVSCNNSPIFTHLAIPNVCVGQPVTYNFGVTEQDGDSLAFRLADPYINFYNTSTNSFGTGLFVTPYSYTDPFDVPVSLNPTNGELNFTPVTQGNWTIKVCVDEYRNGVKIGTVCRDIQFFVISCSNVTPYLLNSGITNLQGNGILIDSNSIQACSGSTISFDISFGDSLYTQSTPAQTSGDSVSLTSTIATNLPGATVTYTSGNTATAHVNWNIPSNFTGQLINAQVNARDNACNFYGISSFTFDIVINPGQYYNNSNQVSICKGDTINLQAIGGTSFVWDVIQNPDGSIGAPIIISGLNQNFSDTSGTNAEFIWSSPAHTTTYQITSDLSPFCNYVDTLTVYVSRDFNFTTFGDTFVCPNDSVYDFQIGATVDTSSNSGGAPFNFSYDWSGGATLNNDSVNSPIATITQNNSYQVTISSDSGCVKTGSINIGFAPEFPTNIGVTFSDSLLCLGDSTTAYVDFGEFIGPNCGLASSPCNSTPDIGYSGTGTSTNTTTSYPAPYGNYYWGAKHQILYTAAELQAMGMTNGGKISSLAFDVANTNGTTYLANYTIRIGCTSASDLSSAWETGLTTVFGPTTHTPTTGWNVHNFTTPYNWNGTSNLVVEICFNNSSFNSNASTYYSTTPFTSVSYYRADYANVCSNTTTATTSSNRPNTQFEFCTGYDPAAYTYAWNPNADISDTSIIDPFVYPNVNTTYTVVLSDTFGACSDTLSGTIQVVSNLGASFSYPDSICANDIDTLIPVINGGTFSGNGITNGTLGVFDGSAANLGLNTIYYNVSSYSGGCSASDSVEITVDSIPQVTILDSTFCRTSGTQVLSTNYSGGIWSGPGIIDSINGVLDPTLLPNNTQAFYSYSENTCQVVDTFNLQLYSPVSILGNQATICANDTLYLNDQLNIWNGSFPYTPLISWSDTSLVNDTLFAVDYVSGVHTFYYTSHDSDSLCVSNPNFIQVTINDTVAITQNSILDFCETDNTNYGTSSFYSPTLSIINTQPILGTNSGINSVFRPSTTGVGNWLFSGEYINPVNGCISNVLDTINISSAPDASFTYSDTGLTVGFSSNAVSGDQANWIFGDGFSSTQFNPSHNYSGSGIYIVELTVTNACGFDVSTDTINIFNVGIDAVEDENWIQIYPNPSSDFIQFKNTSASLIEGELIIYNINGSIVHQKSVGLSPYSEMRIDHKLANGTYWLNLQTEDGRSITAKLIVSQ